MGHSASHVVTKASDLVDEEGGLQNFFANVGIGGIGYSLILLIVTLIRGVEVLTVGPIVALGEGTITLVEAMFNGFVDVMDAGTANAVRSFTDGVVALLGPLTQPLAVGTFMASIFVFVWFAQRIEWSPWVFITSIRS